MPLHSALGARVRLCVEKKNNKQKTKKNPVRTTPSPYTKANISVFCPLLSSSYQYIASSDCLTSVQYATVWGVPSLGLSTINIHLFDLFPMLCHLKNVIFHNSAYRLFHT